MIKNGINLRTGETYEEYIAKHKNPDPTTDDTFTPSEYMNIVNDYVAEKYKIDKSQFLRPFWPGEDYRAYDYQPEDVVVDNPPFSILSQITSFYDTVGVRYFLFCPGLTGLNNKSVRTGKAALIAAHANLVYENGAKIVTSFVTNMEPGIRARTEPYLRVALDKAARIYNKKDKKELPKYAYPESVLTAAMLGQLSKYGISYTATVKDTIWTPTLDEQRKHKKTIFGAGCLLSEKAAAEKAAAEKAAAEKAAAKIWRLSEREKAEIASMSEIKQ